MKVLAQTLAELSTSTSLSAEQRVLLRAFLQGDADAVEAMLGRNRGELAKGLLRQLRSPSGSPDGARAKPQLYLIRGEAS